MSKYQYINPTKLGMTKLPVTLRQLYKMGLAGRGNPLFIKAVVYADSSKGVIEYRHTLLAKLICVPLMPFFVLWVGLRETTWRDIASVFWQSKYPSHKRLRYEVRFFNGVVIRLLTTE